MKRWIWIACLLTVAACSAAPSAELKDPGGHVTDWAVDRLAAYGLDEGGILAQDQPLPRWIWTNPETGTVVIAYLGPGCRQYPVVGVTASDGRLMVSIDPVTGPEDDCSRPDVAWGLALDLADPWTADDVVPSMQGPAIERG